jgi:hypothetical protein
VKITKEELNKLIEEELQPAMEKDRLDQLRLLLTEALKKVGLDPMDMEGYYSEKDGIKVTLGTQRGDSDDVYYRIVMRVAGNPPPSPPPEQNTKAKGTHLSLVRENKITKSQLRQIIKEEIEAEQSDTTPRGDS